MSVTDLEHQLAGSGAYPGAVGEFNSVLVGRGFDRADVLVPAPTFLLEGESVELTVEQAELALEAEDLRVDKFREQGAMVVDTENSTLFVSAGFISPAAYRELAYGVDTSEVWTLIRMLGAENVAIGGVTISGEALPRIPGVRQISIRDPRLEPSDLIKAQHDFLASHELGPLALRYPLDHPDDLVERYNALYGQRHRVDDSTWWSYRPEGWRWHANEPDEDVLDTTLLDELMAKHGPDRVMIGTAFDPDSDQPLSREESRGQRGFYVKESPGRLTVEVQAKKFEQLSDSERRYIEWFSGFLITLVEADDKTRVERLNAAWDEFAAHGANTFEVREVIADLHDAIAAKSVDSYLA